MDHLIPLPPNFKYLNQFLPSTWAPNPSKFRCVTASVSMLAEIAYPGRWIPEELEHDLYVKWAGPDVATDTQGVAKQPVLDWLHSVGIGFIDLEHLIGSDMLSLHAEMQAMNDAGVPQLITVADESKLFDAKTGVKLHNWADQGMAHSFVRVGYSTDQGWAYYFEPASPGFTQPVPISWQDSIIPAGIITAIAIFPHGMQEYPPKPQPVLDVAKAEVTLAAALTALSAAQAGLSNLANDLAALKGEI